MVPPMAKPFIVTSMKVDEDLWKRAKKRAIDDEITLQQLLNVAVQEYLRRRTVPDFRRKKHEN
jgi:acyl-CoA hydrolase